jgi:ribosome-binding protein aMBF1 (putative translation factor)
VCGTVPRKNLCLYNLTYIAALAYTLGMQPRKTPRRRVKRSCGEKIRARRLELGMSGAELARKAKRATNHVYMIERDEHEPGRETLKLIARALRTTIAELCGD